MFYFHDHKSSFGNRNRLDIPKYMIALMHHSKMKYFEEEHTMNSKETMLVDEFQLKSMHE